MTTAVPVAFVGGHGRSGSTLLSRVLGAVPGFVHRGRALLPLGPGRGHGPDVRLRPAVLRLRAWAAVGTDAFGGWDRVDARGLLALRKAVERVRYTPLLSAPAVSPDVRPQAAGVRGGDVRGLRVGPGGQRRRGGRGHLEVPVLGVPAAARAGRRAKLVHLGPLRVRRVLLVVEDGRAAGPGRQADAAVPAGPDRGRVVGVQLPARRAAAARACRRSSCTTRTSSRRRGRSWPAIVRFLGKEPSRADLAFVGSPACSCPRDHSVAGNPMRFRSGPSSCGWTRPGGPSWTRATRRLISVVSAAGDPAVRVRERRFRHRGRRPLTRVRRGAGRAGVPGPLLSAGPAWAGPPGPTGIPGPVPHLSRGPDPHPGPGGRLGRVPDRACRRPFPPRPTKASRTSTCRNLHIAPTRAARDHGRDQRGTSRSPPIARASAAAGSTVTQQHGRGHAGPADRVQPDRDEQLRQRHQVGDQDRHRPADRRAEDADAAAAAAGPGRAGRPARAAPWPGSRCSCRPSSARCRPGRWPWRRASPRRARPRRRSRWRTCGPKMPSSAGRERADQQVERPGGEHQPAGRGPVEQPGLVQVPAGQRGRQPRLQRHRDRLVAELADDQEPGGGRVERGLHRAEDRDHQQHVGPLQPDLGQRDQRPRAGEPPVLGPGEAGRRRRPSGGAGWPRPAAGPAARTAASPAGTARSRPARAAARCASARPAPRARAGPAAGRSARPSPWSASGRTRG